MIFYDKLQVVPRLKHVIYVLPMIWACILNAPAHATTCQSGGKIFDTSEVVWSKHHKTHLYCAGDNQWRYLAQWGLTGQNHLVHMGGRIGIGTNQPERIIHVLGSGDVDDDVIIESVNNNNSSGGIIAFFRARGSNDAKKSPLKNDFLASFSGRGWNEINQTYADSGSIHVRAAEDWSVNQSAYINFTTRYMGHSSEKMRITADGHVGIGTSTPRQELHVANGNNQGGGNQTVAQFGTGAGSLFLTHTAPFISSNSRYDDGRWRYEANGAATTISFGSGSGDGQIRFATAPAGNAGDELNFATHMIITNEGHIGIGTGNPTHMLHVNGIARSTQANFVTSSDMRVKTNIHGIENGLDVISRLRPVTYEYTQEYQNNNADLGGVRRGFIAQEVEEVLPDVVTRTTETVGNAVIDDFRVLKNDDFVPLLVRAVQELKAENDVLRAEIERIKSMHDQ